MGGKGINGEHQKDTCRNVSNKRGPTTHHKDVVDDDEHRLRRLRSGDTHRFVFAAGVLADSGAHSR